VATFHQGESLEAVFHRADQAVLAAKRDGRNQVRRGDEAAASGPGA
jgi:PleD family two-component response regulator